MEELSSTVKAATSLLVICVPSCSAFSGNAIASWKKVWWLQSWSHHGNRKQRQLKRRAHKQEVSSGSLSTLLLSARGSWSLIAHSSLTSSVVHGWSWCFHESVIFQEASCLWQYFWVCWQLYLKYSSNSTYQSMNFSFLNHKKPVLCKNLFALIYFSIYFPVHFFTYDRFVFLSSFLS